MSRIVETLNNINMRHQLVTMVKRGIKIYDMIHSIRDDTDYILLSISNAKRFQAIKLKTYKGIIPFTIVMVDYYYMAHGVKSQSQHPNFFGDIKLCNHQYDEELFVNMFSVFVKITNHTYARFSYDGFFYGLLSPKELKSVDEGILIEIVGRTKKLIINRLITRILLIGVDDGFLPFRHDVINALEAMIG